LDLSIKSRLILKWVLFKIEYAKCKEIVKVQPANRNIVFLLRILSSLSSCWELYLLRLQQLIECTCILEWKQKSKAKLTKHCNSTIDISKLLRDRMEKLQTFPKVEERNKNQDPLPSSYRSAIIPKKRQMYKWVQLKNDSIGSILSISI